MSHAKLATGGRAGVQRKRMLDGKEVQATLYYGRHVGHGRYMAGKVDGELVCDSNQKPIPLTKIGYLE